MRRMDGHTMGLVVTMLSGSLTLIVKTCCIFLTQHNTLYRLQVTIKSIILKKYVEFLNGS